MQLFVNVFREIEMGKKMLYLRLSTDFIIENFGHSYFHELCELDRPNCNICTVELSHNELFKNLRR